MFVKVGRGVGVAVGGAGVSVMVDEGRGVWEGSIAARAVWVARREALVVRNIPPIDNRTNNTTPPAAMPRAVCVDG